MSAEVSIGGRPYTIVEPRAYKAALALEIASTVSKELRGLRKEAAEFIREYRQTNMLQITRQMCLERVAELEGAVEEVKADTSTPEDGERTVEQRVRILEANAQSWRRQLEDMGDRPFVEVPQEPDEAEVFMAVIPSVFKMRREATEIIGLVITPDLELMESWRKSTVRDQLRETGEKLLEIASLHEIVRLAIAAKQVLSDVLRPIKPDLNNLLGREEPEPEEAQPQAEESSTTMSSPATQPTPSPQPDSPQPAPPPQPTPEPTPTTPDPTPTSSSPTSSTPSPERTDGESRTSDSLSPGDSPLVSSGA